MNKVIFGSACIVAGLLLVLIMLYIGENPNAFGSLTGLGRLFVGGGVIASIIGFVICIVNLNKE